MRIPFQLSIMASAVILAGCGGGGGGPGGSNVRPPSSGNESYTTPVIVGTIDPLVESTTQFFEYNSFTTDINGDGATDVIFAGRQTATNDINEHSNSKISLYTWQNGTLVDKTSEWFESGENEIKGTEPSVKFTDFFKTGRTDMFVAHGTDMQYYGPSYVYRNTGSKFERIEIPMNNVWSHGSDVGDINGDTYDDIAIVDYGPNTTLAINNTVDNFDIYVDSRGDAGDLRFGGSAITIGDFNNDGSTEFIITDNGCQIGIVGCDNSFSTRMYGYTIDPVTDELNFNYIQDLPLPRLDLPEYNGEIESHNVRVVSHDFNEDGVKDVIVFSRDADWFNKVSEIQFLQNDGSGNFTDVTEDVLIGYNTGAHSTYRPVFFDVNNDGKLDILVSGGDYSGENNSHQFLIKSADNKYVAAYQNILTDFAKGTEMSEGYENSGNTVNVFRAPDGNVYLVSWFQRQSGSERVMQVYLSRLNDTTDVTSPQQAVELLQSTWSYLSDEQAQEALNSTALDLHGGKVINLERAMQPVGDLTVNNITLSGSISAPGLDNNVFSGITALDSLGRGYTVDLSVRGNDDTNIASFNNHYNAGYSLTSSLVADTNVGTYALGDNNTYTGAYTGNAISGWKYIVSHTHIDGYSPWLRFDGAFGEIVSSDTTELALHNRLSNGTWMQFGYTNSQTDIKPGLVVSADPIEALYAVVGHKFDGVLEGLEVMTGVDPKIVAGRLGLKIPERVDNLGQITYNYDTVDLKNQLKKFARFNYTYKMQYDAKIKVGGAFDEDGPTNANITLEMPL